MLDFLKSKNIGVDEFLGLLGFGMVIGVGVYLVLKRLGFFHSPKVEDTLLVIVVGQVFYNGYVYRAVHEIKEIKQEIKEMRRELGEVKEGVISTL